eukprot:1083543-Amphidinium_carterae.1
MSLSGTIGCAFTFPTLRRSQGNPNSIKPWMVARPSQRIKFVARRAPYSSPEGHGVFASRSYCMRCCVPLGSHLYFYFIIKHRHAAACGYLPRNAFVARGRKGQKDNL